MLNLVVADDNFHYAKALINYLTIKYQNLKLINLCTNGTEVIEVLTHNVVDILILDLKMPTLNGLEVLHTITKSNLETTPDIVIISGEPELLGKTYTNLLVRDCISKISNFQDVYRRLDIIIEQKILEKEQYIIKSLIIQELKKLCFNPKHNGTTYITEAILIIYKSSDKNLIENLEKRVYKIIAQRYSKSVHNIKSNICKATNSMYAECEQNYLKNYFHFLNDIKPTPKIIIKTVLTNINSQSIVLQK